MISPIFLLPEAAVELSVTPLSKCFKLTESSRILYPLNFSKAPVLPPSLAARKEIELLVLVLLTPDEPIIPPVPL